MKCLIVIVVFILEYVVCKNPETDFSVEVLEQITKLRKLTTDMEDSGTSFNPFSNVQSISPEDISLIVYTQAQPKGTEILLTDASHITDVSPFNPKLKTVFYVHGWLDTVNSEGGIMVKDALLETANVNVIIVNWDKCATNIVYLVSQGCVADVGKYVGQFVETVSQTYNYHLSDITVVGHSLGAHIAGHVGKYTNGTLGFIVGLDPAGPLYFKSVRDARLTEDDAQYVQAIHTDAIFLGVNYDVGHADYWPNGGFTQKGCGIDTKCSHIKAYKYYAESVTNNAFFSKECDSYDHYEDGDCKQNTKSLMGGLNLNVSVTGNYYLDTNSDSPFGKGDVYIRFL